MGSSGGTSNYKQPNIPAPPADMIAGYGQTAPFTPNFVNFLGDTNVPSTGLTPGMLQQIDSGAYAKPPPASPMGGGGDRNLLAEIMAKLDAMRQPNPMSRQEIMRRAMGRGRMSGGGSDRGGYSTSGREGAGGFGSRSSSASRAGGGLY